MPDSSSRSVAHPERPTTLEPQFNITPVQWPRCRSRTHTAHITTDTLGPGTVRRATTHRRRRPDQDVFLNRHSKWIILKPAGWGNRYAGGPPAGGRAVEKRLTDGSEGECLWRP